MLIKPFLAAIIGLSLSSCATFDETHYFASIDQATQTPVNYFRLKIKGDAKTTGMRYVSGFYDERAVDLFLNETKSTKIDNFNLEGAAVPPIFPTVNCTGKNDAECTALQQPRLSLVPVGNKGKNDGVFVMILSSNADSIATTIGAFAEEQQNVTNVMYLLNSDLYKDVARTKALAPIEQKNRNLVLQQLSAQLLAADSATTSTENSQVYLGILNSIATTINPSARGFTDIAAAKLWFSTRLPRETPQ